MDESQVFRIDHFLGKETVQNIMALRFSNGIFEPLWNRHYIDHVQITAAETVGVEERARSFTRSTGALRDMVPNHMFQLLAMTAMEPPNTFDADAVRDEKAKVLEAIKPLDPMRVARDVVRGQYAAGRVGESRRQRLSPGGRCRPRQPDRNLRRDAAQDRQFPLGRGAVLHPHRQAHGGPRGPRSRSTSSRRRTPCSATRRSSG